MTDVWTEMMSNRLTFRERTLTAVKERLAAEAAAKGKKAADDAKAKPAKAEVAAAPAKSKAQEKKDKAVEVEAPATAEAPAPVVETVVDETPAAS